MGRETDVAPGRFGHVRVCGLRFDDVELSAPVSERHIDGTPHVEDTL